MSKVKHHFVPVFYLKKFAKDRSSGDPKQISIYNIENRKNIVGASLKAQCYKKRFHGETDHLEDAISEVEGHIAPAVRNVISSESVAKKGSEDWEWLIAFLALQWARTTRIAKNLDSYNERMMKGMVRLDAELDPESDIAEVVEHLDEIDIRMTDPVYETLRIGLSSYPVLSDLEMHLLKAPSGHQFVTSDDPVCLYNKYCEGITHTGVTGLVASGLMVFLPISPELCLLMLDSDIYRINNRPVGGGCLLVTSSDVRRVNGLQFAQAEANLYHSGEVDENYFQGLYDLYERYRGGPDIHIQEFANVVEDGESIMMHYQAMKNMHLSFSFLRFTNWARTHRASDRGQLFRPSALAIMDEIDKEDIDGEAHDSRRRIPSGVRDFKFKREL